MNYKEAKEILRSVAEGGSCDMTELAVHVVLEELKRLEGKEKAVKVDKNSFDISFCPKCGGSLWQNRDESNYCFRCGQKVRGW